MKHFWEERYKQPAYAYGEQPNAFFQAQLAQRPPGRLLLPAEGEGRNAVYAAARGWQVEAFDYAEAARHKAMQLAAARNVHIAYAVADYRSFQPVLGPFDLVALVYAHADPAMRRSFHRRVVDWLAPGGEVILEGFSKKQWGRPSGGPRQQDMLWSLEALRKDFQALEVTAAQEQVVHLEEGEYHRGEAVVVRMTARKASQE